MGDKQLTLEQLTKKMAAATPLSIETESAAHAQDLAGRLMDFVLQEYYHQKNGERAKFDTQSLMTDFVKDSYILDEAHADIAAHKVVMYAMKGAFPAKKNETEQEKEDRTETLAERYDRLLQSYIKEKDAIKRASIKSELDLLYALGPRFGVDVEKLNSLKKEGFKPNDLQSVIERLASSLASFRTEPVIRETIPEKDAYAVLAQLGDEYGVSPEVIKAAGPQAARAAIGLAGRVERQEPDKDKRKDVYRCLAPVSWYQTK